MTSLLRLLAALVLAVVGVGAQQAFAQTIIIWPPRPIPVPPPDIRPPPPPPPAPLELRKHLVATKITDQVAVTTIEQVFFNPSNARAEGDYVFPIPVGANIDKLTMEVNGKPTDAELLDAEKAKKIYEDIVRRSRDPALLEYIGRGLVRVRIFPIEGQSEKRITLKYTQVLKSDNGLVSYGVPLGPQRFNDTPIGMIGVKIDVACTKPLKTIYSPTHNVEIKRGEGASSGTATVGFEAKDVRPLGEFQLVYAAERDKNAGIGVNIMTYDDGSPDGGYFLLLISPGDVAKDQPVVKKDIVFVLDTSGSMAGDKIEQARKALAFCINNLNEGDRFQVVRFSTETESLFDGLVDVNKENREKALAFAANLKAIGGTAIESALTEAMKPLAKDPKSDRPYTVIFLTDGQPTVGATDEDALVKLVPDEAKEKGGRRPRVFCFGIGFDVNTRLLDRVAEKSRASTTYVSPSENLEIKVSNFYARISDPVLTNPTLKFEGNVKVSKTHPGELPDVFRGDQVVVLGRYTGGGGAAVTLTGSVNGKEKSFTNEATFLSAQKDGAAAKTNDFIPRLWATRRVGFLLDAIRLNGENKEVKEEVIELARKYGIVTPYTSYLIVEDERQRDVPMPARTQARADRDRNVDNAIVLPQAQLSGEGAVEAAKSTREMRDTTAASSPSSGGRGGGGASQGGLGGATRLNAMQQAHRKQDGAPGGSAGNEPAAPAPRFAGGKTFYVNGDTWIDSAIQAKQSATRKKIEFGSKEYFELLDKHPDARAWFAVATKVQVMIGDTIYEITEASEK